MHQGKNASKLFASSGSARSKRAWRISFQIQLYNSKKSETYDHIRMKLCWNHTDKARTMRERRCAPNMRDKEWKFPINRTAAILLTRWLSHLRLPWCGARWIDDAWISVVYIKAPVSLTSLVNRQVTVRILQPIYWNIAVFEVCRPIADVKFTSFMVIGQM